MAGNTLGTIFKVMTFGESHGPAIGVVVEGCPSGIPFDMELVNRDLQRRRPGQSAVTTSRKEAEQPVLLSGVFEGKTTGTPIALLVYNQDHRSSDYKDLKQLFRPSHADYTYFKKYGHRDYRGGGRASARETVARVIAGAIAKMVLSRQGIKILAYTHSIGQWVCSSIDRSTLDTSIIESNVVRCPDIQKAEEMEAGILQAKSEGDTLGGVVKCIIRGVPVGLGEPVFDKLHAQLGHAVLSIPACKGFEIGAGFASTLKRGSDLNDIFEIKEGEVSTSTNNSGGIQGGISNGQDIVFSAAFKPVSTLLKKQKTVTKSKEEIEYIPRGRHDPCVVPRAVPIVEAMAAMVICDAWLMYKAMK